MLITGTWVDTGKACERSAPEAHIYIQFVVTRVGNRCNQICDVFSSDKPITSFFFGVFPPAQLSRNSDLRKGSQEKVSGFPPDTSRLDRKSHIQCGKQLSVLMSDYSFLPVLLHSAPPLKIPFTSGFVISCLEGGKLPV